MSEGDMMKDGIPAIIEAARGVRGAQVIDVAGGDNAFDGIQYIPMVAVPQAGGGTAIVSVKSEIDAWRKEHATMPARRMGTATFDEIDSFIAHAVRFKDGGSAIFVSGGATAPKFTAVLDYHPAGEIAKVNPRFGQHRGVYSPAFSDEWKAWKENDGRSLTQAQFAALINTNVRDVFDVGENPAGRLAEAPAWYAKRFGGKRDPVDFYASAQRLLELAEGLTVTVEDRVSDVARRDSGEMKISFESKGVTDIEIPVAFVLELPVFTGGDLFQIPVRLRFSIRTDGDTKRAVWRIEMFGAARTVLACVADLRATVATKTGLPIFAGSPE